MCDNHPNFPGFESVCLEDSYVLDITVHPAVLSLQLDLLLLPGHPKYGLCRATPRGCRTVVAREA